MAAELAVAQVEGLVVDEQADDLAVGDVHERLSGLRIAVAGLRVRQRAQLVEGVQVGAGQAERLALVEISPQPDVPVREREHRLRPGERVEVELRLAHRPGLDGESGPAAHRRSSSSAKSETTRSAPSSAKRVGVTGPIDADDEAEAAGAAGGDARERVLEDRRVRPARRRAREPPRERCPERASRGGALPRRALRRSAPRTGRSDPPLRGRRGSSRWPRRPRGASRHPARPARTAPIPRTARALAGGSARARARSSCRRAR